MILTHGANSLERGGGDFVEIGGRKYPVVKIGNQLWIAHNLDWAWEGLVVGSSTSSSQQRANYFNNDESTYGWNGRKYGLLYNSPAIAYLDTILSDGWRTATSTDWDTLITNTGSTSKESADNLRSDDMPWNTPLQGYNIYGMNMLCSGARGADGSFITGGNYGDEGYYNGSDYYIYDLYKDGFGPYYDGHPGSQKSVRLVKDAT